MNFDTSCLTKELEKSREFFDRSTRELKEEDSGFKPTPEMMTAAQQIAHNAHTIHWFLDGAFSPTGFDMDFEKHGKELAKVSSITAARAELDKAYRRAMQELNERPASEWTEVMADKVIMPGAPRFSVISAIVEHTSHHRGALSVYTRLVGKVPPMPYADM